MGLFSRGEKRVMARARRRAVKRLSGRSRNYLKGRWLSGR